ncbi:hypothetical protein BN2497_6737 [Janthinobacterium sp. CG23_2]|nr:hypothetical protein BN2497_6737 [Janthinobacterium sp. CG23_2]CUU29766.1 hypothetical protein BN3177_6737 [Janthinobacterium sp. CG23_2]
MNGARGCACVPAEPEWRRCAHTRIGGALLRLRRRGLRRLERTQEQ